MKYLLTDRCSAGLGFALPRPPLHRQLPALTTLCAGRQACLSSSAWLQRTRAGRRPRKQRAAAAPVALGTQLTVADVMVPAAIVKTCSPSTPIDEALELLVRSEVTGLPVLDEAGQVQGVVSDFDLLGLEGLGSREHPAGGLFPRAEASWEAFREAQRQEQQLGAGRTVSQVMTPDPLLVPPATTLKQAANLLLSTRVRRVLVVDKSNRLLGVVTCGNILQAALDARKRAGAGG